MSSSHDKLANLKTFLRCVIEDCKAGAAMVDSGVGAIAMLVEAVDARDWESVNVWMQALRRTDTFSAQPANSQESDAVLMTVDASTSMH